MLNLDPHGLDNYLNVTGKVKTCNTFCTFWVPFVILKTVSPGQKSPSRELEKAAEGCRAKGIQRAKSTTKYTSHLL